MSINVVGVSRRPADHAGAVPGEGAGQPAALHPTPGLGVVPAVDIGVDII